MVDCVIECVVESDWVSATEAMDSAEQWLEVPQVSGWMIEWVID